MTSQNHRSCEVSKQIGTQNSILFVTFLLHKLKLIIISLSLRLLRLLLLLVNM